MIGTCGDCGTSDGYTSTGPDTMDTPYYEEEATYYGGYDFLDIPEYYYPVHVFKPLPLSKVKCTLGEKRNFYHRRQMFHKSGYLPKRIRNIRRTDNDYQKTGQLEFQTRV